MLYAPVTLCCLFPSTASFPRRFCWPGCVLLLLLLLPLMLLLLLQVEAL
jgi:hypothetical protein